MLVLVLALAALVGVVLGLLGGGGSILMVPLLTLVAGLAPKEAIATSLLVVGVTSLAALVPHARAGRVRWRTGVTFGLAAMVGAYAGGRLAAFIPGRVLLAGFALLMLATAIAMIRGRRGGREQSDDTSAVPVPARSTVRTTGRYVLQGVAVGLVTGTVGAGGGFLVVPALVLLGGLSMTAAVATSLLVIAMNSAAGLAGHLASTALDWPFALSVTALAVVGAVAGGLFAGRVPQATLRTAFGWFVLAMGALVLGQSALAG
ncbi:MAG: sulfite exporter TauE/SafE family protein [Ornithinibacter sp.]